MKTYFKNCVVCRKEIKIIRILMGQRSSNEKKSWECSSSDEGVYFKDSCCWFCNKCWEKVRK